MSPVQFQGEAGALALGPLAAPQDKPATLVISVIPVTLHGVALDVCLKSHYLTSSFSSVLLILCTNKFSLSTAVQVKLRISREGGCC